jgi:TetR/AcrR family transcriptional repressor of nem operon
MPKSSHREKLLAEGMLVVHERGFGTTSVRDIAQAAKVPQGSFTNHFASKEAFALEVIDLYRQGTLALVGRTLRNDALPPLQRLRDWIDAQLGNLKKYDMRRGCLYGNFTAEASEHSEAIRAHVGKIFAESQANVAHCLSAAVAAGELPPGTETDDLAGFIVSSMQGATLVAKAQRSPEPIERFAKVLFTSILQKPALA